MNAKTELYSIDYKKVIPCINEQLLDWFLELEEEKPIKTFPSIFRDNELALRIPILLNNKASSFGISKSSHIGNIFLKRTHDNKYGARTEKMTFRLTQPLELIEDITIPDCEVNLLDIFFIYGERRDQDPGLLFREDYVFTKGLWGRKQVDLSYQLPTEWFLRDYTKV